MNWPVKPVLPATIWRSRSRVRVCEEFVVVLPVALDFEHDALKFGVSTQFVPVPVALEPGKVMISTLNGASQPGESRLFVAQERIRRANPFRRSPSTASSGL
jgi:hypothetical protein